MTAVVPTYKEADTIATLVGRLNHVCDSVIVVDKPSGDKTAKRTTAAGGWYMAVPEDGLGPAYAKAWSVIPDDHWVLHIDCGSHLVIDAVDLIDFAAHRRADITIGSRFLAGSVNKASASRRWLSRFAAAAMNASCASDISDWTSGFRVYSPKVRQELALHDFSTRGHAWQIEALHVARQHGYTVREQPITYMPSRSSLSVKRLGEAARLVGRLAWE